MNNNIIHHIKNKYLLNVDCELKGIPKATFNWDNVSCPECLKHRGEK